MTNSFNHMLKRLSNVKDALKIITYYFKITALLVEEIKFLKEVHEIELSQNLVI